MIKRGDRVRLVIPQKYMGKEGYRRWHGMTGIAEHGSDNAYCEARFDKKADFWRGETAVFSRELVQLARPLTSFEENLMAYIAAEKKELGI